MVKQYFPQLFIKKLSLKIVLKKSEVVPDRKIFGPPVLPPPFPPPTFPSCSPPVSQLFRDEDDVSRHPSHTFPRDVIMTGVDRHMICGPSPKAKGHTDKKGPQIIPFFRASDGIPSFLVPGQSAPLSISTRTHISQCVTPLQYPVNFPLKVSRAGIIS